ADCPPHSDTGTHLVGALIAAGCHCPVKACATRTSLDLLPNWRARALLNSACPFPERGTASSDHRCVGAAAECNRSLQARPARALSSRARDRFRQRVEYRLDRL